MTSDLNTRDRRQMVAALAVNTLIIILEFIGLALCLPYEGWGLFRYYTQDSNLLALIACALTAAYQLISIRRGRRMIPRAVHVFKYISVCCLTVTFLVVLFVLAPLEGMDSLVPMFINGSALYYHLLCPLLALFGFLFLEPQPPIERRDALVALIPTLIYAAITITLNLMRKLDGPYPFLRVYARPWWASCLWCIAILGLAALIAFVIGACSRRRAS